MTSDQVAAARALRRLLGADNTPRAVSKIADADVFVPPTASTAQMEVDPIADPLRDGPGKFDEQTGPRAELAGRDVKGETLRDSLRPMAKQTVTTFIDDIDGSEGAETIAFAYRGTNYTIDLSEKNAAAFDKALNKYVTNATRERARRTSARSSGGSASGKRTDLAEIRAWAAENGYEVSSRGRIAAEIVEAYDVR